MAELAFGLIRYAVLYLLSFGRVTAAVRAEWLHNTAFRLSRAFGMKMEVVGSIPAGGLLVANHLSYLDIVLIAAIARPRFVSKKEVRSWPVFGLFAYLGGTIFIDRTRRNDTARANLALKEALESRELVVLFPEGTSSDGSSVLPFRSSLLEPAANAKGPLFVAHISYSLPNGSVADEVCYWRDMTLFPHLVNLLGRRNLVARVVFAPVESSAGNRKELAQTLHAQVVRLKSEHSL